MDGVGGIIKALKEYGTPVLDRYKIGCLEINTLGYVFNTAPAHFVGHINTVEELEGVVEHYTDKKLSEELDKQISIFSGQVENLLNSSNN